MNPLPPFLARLTPSAALGVIIAIRILAELTWWFEVGPISLNQLITLMLLIPVTWYAASGAGDSALRWPVGALGVVVVLGLFRAPSFITGMRFALLYAAPLAVLLAVERCAEGEIATPSPSIGPLLRAPTLAAIVPVLLALGALAVGQPSDNIQHGYARLFGPYANVHGCALAMVMFSLQSLWWVERGRKPAILLALGAWTALYFTYVRSAWLLFAGVVVIRLLLRRQYRALVVIGVAGFAAVTINPALADRMSDFYAVLTLQAPPAGWESIGSFRLAIWRDSMTAFADKSPLVWVFGTGLGGHLSLWDKPLDPHSEPLAVLQQLGLLGVLATGWLTASITRLLWRVRRQSTGQLVFALWLSMLVVGLISNPLLARPTIAWLLAVWVGWGVQAGRVAEK